MTEQFRGLLNKSNKVIVPIVNFIIAIVGFLVNTVAKAVNFIIDLLNYLPFVDIKRASGMDTEGMKLKQITAVNSGSVDYSQAAKSSGGGSGSYTAAKDVIVNIYFEHSFVNGDAREIALMLENELESAHALGY